MEKEENKIAEKTHRAHTHTYTNTQAHVLVKIMKYVR